MRTYGRLFVMLVLPSLLMCSSSVLGAERFALTVINAADGQTLLPGVEVSVVTRDGAVRILGKTDRFGVIVIEKRVLRENGASVVLCCHEFFFCGALRVKEDQLLEYDEYLIAISPVIVR